MKDFRRYGKTVLLTVVLMMSFMFRAEAVPVQLYDGGVEDFLRFFQAGAADSNIDFWGTNYGTYEGEQCCETYYGDSEDNVIRFYLNDDRSISRMLISIPKDSVTGGNTESVGNVGFFIGLASMGAGLTGEETKSLWNGFNNDEGTMVEGDASGESHKRYRHSQWCPKTQRHILLEAEVVDDRLEFYISAYQ